MDGNFDSSILAPCVVANLSVAYCEHLRLYLADMYILYMYIYIYIYSMAQIYSLGAGPSSVVQCGV